MLYADTREKLGGDKLPFLWDLQVILTPALSTKTPRVVLIMSVIREKAPPLSQAAVVCFLR
jgi:hypothetical protein